MNGWDNINNVVGYIILQHALLSFVLIHSLSGVFGLINGSVASCAVINCKRRFELWGTKKIVDGYQRASGE